MIPNWNPLELRLMALKNLKNWKKRRESSPEGNQIKWRLRPTFLDLKKREDEGKEGSNNEKEEKGEKKEENNPKPEKETKKGKETGPENEKEELG